MTKKITFSFICLLLLLGCMGCGANTPPEPIIITATPERVVIVVTATPVPLPTIPPTPTAVPGEALRTAELYLHNGEYGNALETFYQVTDPSSGASADVQAAALYGMGETALRAGRFDEAAVAFSNFLVQFPTDGRAAWAHFLRGDALLGMGQWAQAIADFEQYKTLRPGVIDSYIYERVGDATVGLGDVNAALANYEIAIQSGRGLVPLLVLREKVAQVYLNSGQPTYAAAQYEAILAVAENDGYRAEIMFLAAQAQEAQGSLAEAYARYQSLMERFPESPYAYQALQKLLEVGQAVLPEVWARVAFAAEDYQDAISALHLYSAEIALAEIPVDLLLMQGQSYRALGNTDAALTSFQAIVELAPTSESFGQALLEQGRTRFLVGDLPAAIFQYQYLADTYPQLTEAAEALWRVGYLQESQAQTVEAIATYERLARSYPGNEWAVDGLLRAATIALNQGDAATAERVLAALGATASGTDAAAAFLELGKLAQQNGNAAQAESAFRAASTIDLGGYYSIRAEDLLAGRGVFVPPPALNFTFDEAAEQAQAEDWLRATFGITQVEPLAVMSETLQADQRIVAGSELWALLAFDEAGEEFFDILDQYRDDPLVSYQLTLWLQSIDAYIHSIVGAANVIKAADVSTLQAPPYLARLRYPAYYADLVVPEMQSYSLDPLLLFSLIRQESLYDRYATAAAGEKGLTQVIPGTGDYIAQRLNWPDYQHEDLFQPHASIAFGAYYLYEQINYFEFNVPVGVAAYNAGPGNAAQWLTESGSDVDRFVEAIGFPGTKLYVQRLYEHYHVYRSLYGTG